MGALLSRIANFGCFGSRTVLAVTSDARQLTSQFRTDGIADAEVGKLVPIASVSICSKCATLQVF